MKLITSGASGTAGQAAPQEVWPWRATTHGITPRRSQRGLENQKHLHVDVQMFDEPQFKAVCETSAEVLQGLVKAFRDYDAGKEAAWRERT